MTLHRRKILWGGLASVTAAGVPVAVNSLFPKRLEITPPDADLKGSEDPIVESEINAPRPKVRFRSPEDVRRAYVHNLHTGERLNAVYYENGRYVPGVLAAAKHLLRDWHNNQQHFIDPHLFDLLHNLRGKIASNQPFQILSGYRSPATNALMHAQSEQVASRSQHLLGKALDITIEGVDLGRLHRAAVSLRAGGVGYYPDNGFVHVDVGRVRQWTDLDA